MAKEKFMGKTQEEMKKISFEEFLKMINARARRSLKKGKYLPLEKKIEKGKKMLEEGKQPKPIRTHRRDKIITPNMLGLKFAIYNGKEFVVREINVEMLGHYLGEFALTREFVKHGKAGIGATRSSKATERK